MLGIRGWGALGYLWVLHFGLALCRGIAALLRLENVAQGGAQCLGAAVHHNGGEVCRERGSEDGDVERTRVWLVRRWQREQLAPKRPCRTLRAACLAECFWVSAAWDTKPAKFSASPAADRRLREARTQVACSLCVCIL